MGRTSSSSLVPPLSAAAAVQQSGLRKEKFRFRQQTTLPHSRKAEKAKPFGLCVNKGKEEIEEIIVLDCLTQKDPVFFSSESFSQGKFSTLCRQQRHYCNSNARHA